MNRTYIMREATITIGNRTEMLIVENFESNEPCQLYFCKFSIRDNNEESFYNKYDAFGFYVEFENDVLSFKLIGKVDAQTANEIWRQVEPQLSKAEALVLALV